MTGPLLENRYDAHVGMSGVLFGKGPSLDEWDSHRLPDEIWMTINEACRAIPEADYHIMTDHAVIKNLLAQRWKPSKGLVLTRGTT